MRLEVHTELVCGKPLGWIGILWARGWLLWWAIGGEGNFRVIDGVGISL